MYYGKDFTIYGTDKSFKEAKFKGNSIKTNRKGKFFVHYKKTNNKIYYISPNMWL